MVEAKTKSYKSRATYNANGEVDEMTEQEAVTKMVAPGTPRPGKYRQGVIQVHLTRSCDKACYGCTQASNLRGPVRFMTPDQFETAVLSLKTYWGVVGVFGGNPAVSPHFEACCEILRAHIPWEQRGLWCNNPLGKGKIMRETFNPAVSNLNVHLDAKAYAEFKKDWPECNPVGLTKDSRHSPPWVAIQDLKEYRKPCPDIDCNANEYDEGMYVCSACNGTGTVPDEAKIWATVSDCPINKHWSALVGVFRGEVRAWFCEIAGAQAMLRQDEPDYPDTGLRADRMYDDGEKYWWQLPMHSFSSQARWHCFRCGVAVQGYGELAIKGTGPEQVSQEYADVYKPKKQGREVQVVTEIKQLEPLLGRMTDYLGNASK